MNLPRTILALVVVAGCSMPVDETFGPKRDPAAAASAVPSAAPGPDPACGDVPRDLLAPKCATAGCHAPPDNQGHLDLASPGVEHRLIGVKDTTGAFFLINPTDPEESLMYERVVGARAPRMPMGAPLDEQATACLLSWIKNSVGPSARGDGGELILPPSDDGGRDGAISDGESTTVVRVAAGATTAYTDSAGHVWSPDHHFSGGDVATHDPEVPIMGTNDASLYNKQRYGIAGSNAVSFRYDLPVPNGNYQVTLKFAETYLTSSGQRLFDVSINQEKKLTAFDIFEEAGGANIAVDKTFTTSVTSGTLSIVFDPAGADFPKVDAIEVLPQ